MTITEMITVSFKFTKTLTDFGKLNPDPHALDVISSVAHAVVGHLRDGEGNVPGEYFTECHSLYKLPEMHPEETAILGTHTEIAMFPTSGWWNVENTEVSICFEKSATKCGDSMFEELVLRIRTGSVVAAREFVDSCMKKMDQRKRCVVHDVENVIKQVKTTDERLRSVGSNASSSVYM